MEDQINRIEEINMEADKARLANRNGPYETSAILVSTDEHKGKEVSKRNNKTREYRKMKNFFPVGQLNPADWKRKQTIQIREPIYEEYVEIGKVGRPSRKRPSEELSRSSEDSVALKKCKGSVSTESALPSYEQVMDDFVKAVYEGNFVMNRGASNSSKRELCSSSRKEFQYPCCSFT